MKPVIGITVDIEDDLFLSTPAAYMTSVERAGGLPLVIPYYEREDSLDSVIALCDGFLFSGGVDIDPRKYGEEKLAVCGEISVNRDRLELALLEKIMATSKPILGVCRGCQLVNVALGGTLWQDIPSQLGTSLTHKQTEPKFSHSHYVNIREETPLYSLMGCDRIRANSFHHQSIKSLGRGLEIMAVSDDGIVEAVYLPGERYLRAYQWHPERLFAIDGYQQRIFLEFIAACRK